MNTKYQEEYKKWQQGRPEYAALLKAIRSDEQDRNKLHALAAEAGVDNNALSELRTVRARVKREEAVAARFPAEQKKLEALEAEIAKLKKEKAAGGPNRNAVMLQLRRAIDERDHHVLGDHGAAKSAFDYRQIAIGLGLV